MGYSSGRYMPHVDFDVRLGTHELVKPWWTKSWGRYILASKNVRDTLTEAGAFEDAAESHPVSMSAFNAFSRSFDVVGLQTVWVALNETPCYNNQLALCSWASVDKTKDLKEYQIFGPGITAIGLHPNEEQRWVAPETLQFGQGVRFDAMRAPHSAVARQPPEFQSSAPRVSV